MSAMSIVTHTGKLIVVLGAGVVGLSTSLKILDEGHDVTIVSEILPSDPKSIRYTSHWAVCYPR